jgi:hypothetical protein
MTSQGQLFSRRSLTTSIHRRHKRQESLGCPEVVGGSLVGHTSIFVVHGLDISSTCPNGLVEVVEGFLASIEMIDAQLEQALHLAVLDEIQVEAHDEVVGGLYVLLERRERHSGDVRMRNRVSGHSVDPANHVCSTPVA